MGIEQNRTEHTELEPYFGAKRAEPNEPNVISLPNRTVRLFEPNRTEQDLCAKGSIPMAVNNSQIWMTHPFIKLWCFCQSVLLKHFNCERPPDCRTKCKIVNTRVLQSDFMWLIHYNRTEPEPRPWPNRTETEFLLVGSIPITKSNRMLTL